MQRVVKFKEDTGPNEHHRRREEMPERGGAWPQGKGMEYSKTSDHLLQTYPGEVAGGGIFYFDTTTRVPKAGENASASTVQLNTVWINTDSVPTKKNTKLKLKSIVQKVPSKEMEACPTSGWQPDWALPYHSMAEKLEDFMHYIMQSGLMVHDHLITEIDDLMIFGHEQSSIACQIVTSILYTELAWFKGYPYTFPVIPSQLERRAPDPEGAPISERPRESRSRHAVGLKENCQVWWHYLLALLQYWKDAKSLFPYGGLLRRDSNLLMYVYHRIKHLLCMGRVELQHYSVKSQMAWMVYAQMNYMPDQITKQRETYATIVDELQELKNWLHKHYEVEADVEIHQAEQCGGDIHKMSQPRISKDLCPGNEDLYVAMEKKETHPKM